MAEGRPGSPAFGQILKVIVNPEAGRSMNFGVNVASVSGKYILAGVSESYTEDGVIRNYGPGRAYVFDGDPASPNFGALLLTILNPHNVTGDQFGFAVAAAGDNFLIGAPYDSTFGIEAGAVYLFEGYSTLRERILRHLIGQTSAEPDMDVNADGRVDSADLLLSIKP